MRSKTFLVFGAAVAALLAVPAAQALLLDFTSPYYVGEVRPGGGNPGEEAAQVNNLTGLPAPSGPTDIGSNTYIRSANYPAPFSFPTADATDSFKQDNGNTTVSFTGLFQYVVGKYNGDNGGLAVWFKEDGFEGPLTLMPFWEYKDTPDGQVGQYALSHTTLLNPVPDQGMTLLLLGLALTGLAFVRRRIA
jgi:hypothetical protein